MRNFETPWDFFIEKDFGNHKLKYVNLMEVAMGGPEVGNIIIDNSRESSSKYGGPAVSDGVFLYIPIFRRTIFNSSFRICRVNMVTLEVETFGKNKNVILIDRIDNNILYYFEDEEKTTELIFRLPEY